MFERVRECVNPGQAFENYMNFDLAVGRYIIHDAKRLGLCAIEVGNDSDIIRNVEAVSSHFKLD